MTSPSHKSRPTTRWSTLRAICNASVRELCLGCAGLVAGLGLTGTAAAQSSVWDRPVTRSAAATYQTRVASQAAQPTEASQAAWEDVRNAWTPIDSQGRMLKDVNLPVRRTPPPVQSRAVAPAYVPQSAYQSQSDASAANVASRPETLSESIVRHSLLPVETSAPLTASALLRGQTESPWRYELPPAPSSAAGYARLATTVAPSTYATEQAPPLPDHATQYIPEQEERAYRLFESPKQPAASVFGTWQGGASIWDRAEAMQPAYYQAGTEDLLAPAAQDFTAPSPAGVGRVMLDGLDAVSGGEAPNTARYLPTPLNEINPTRDYRPRTSEVTDAAAAKSPQMQSLPENWQMAERSFAAMDFMWMPSNIFYSPLYFEDPALERYGHSHGPLLQPLASVSRFGVQLVGLPYQMALDPPHRRVYPLGFFRPGECAPKQVPNVPLNAEAAAKAGAVYTGLIFAFP